MSTCPSCNGNGYLIVRDPKTGELISVICHTCGGSGK